MELLDITDLPRTAMYGPEGGQVDLAQIVRKMGPAIDDWSRIPWVGDQPLVKPNQSFGFAAAHPVKVVQPALQEYWDDPYRFTWFVAGWGPEGDRYIANALRKLRAALREGASTLKLRQRQLDGESGLFRDVVEKEPEGGTSFQWGDFPWGGAKFVHVGGLYIPCAVSALKEVEDDAQSSTIGGHTGATMLKLDNPVEFG